MYKFGPLVDSVATTIHFWDAWWMLHRSKHQEELESRPIEVIVCANEAHVMIRHMAANLHHMVLKRLKRKQTGILILQNLPAFSWMDGQLEETLSMGIGQILFLQEQMCPILASIIHAASWLFLQTDSVSAFGAQISEDLFKLSQLEACLPSHRPISIFLLNVKLKDLVLD